MKNIILNGMLKAGAFFFLLPVTLFFLLDLYNYLNNSEAIEPFTDNFIWISQIFQHITFYLFISLLGGVCVGIITHIKQKNKGIYH